MAIALNDFFKIVKRQSRYGSPDILTDQATLDILDIFNVKITRIWGKWDWKWQRQKLSFAVTPGTTEYQVKTATAGQKVDRILNIIPRDLTTTPPTLGKPLTQMEIGPFYDMLAEMPIVPALPTKFINEGLDAAGYWKIVIWPSPASAFTMGGYAKAVLTTYVLADVTANNPILYFPNDVINDCLLDGVMSSVKAIQGDDAEKVRLDQMFENKLKMLVTEQSGVGRDNSPPTTKPPRVHGNSRRGRIRDLPFRG